MLSIENLEEFTRKYQTNRVNVVREYFQHLFLSYLYSVPGAEKLLFKGGTALRIVFGSPRFSEDLDFTGSNISIDEVEELFTSTLSNIEKSAIGVELSEGKSTTGGYIGIAVFNAYGMKTKIQIEVSLRRGKTLSGTRALVQSDYLPAYTLVHLATPDLISGKVAALMDRQKPRDFYDYYFLLSGNYPLVRNREYLNQVLKLIKKSRINFRSEIRNFLPASHAMHLRDFKSTLEQKIISFSIKE